MVGAQYGLWDWASPLPLSIDPYDLNIDIPSVFFLGSALGLVRAWEIETHVRVRNAMIDRWGKKSAAKRPIFFLIFLIFLIFFENRLKKIEVLKARNLVSDKIQFTCLRLNLPFGHDISIYRSRIQFTVQKIQFTVRSWDFNLLFEHEISIYPILPSAHEISIYPRPWDFNLPSEISIYPRPWDSNLPSAHEISIYRPIFQFTPPTMRFQFTSDQEISIYRSSRRDFSLRRSVCAQTENLILSTVNFCCKLYNDVTEL